MAKWKKFNRLRTKAFVTDPLAFANTYHENLKKSDQSWQKALEQSILVAAQKDTLPLGMMLAYIHPKSRIRHWAELYGAYVDPDSRGQGIASQMLEKLLLSLKKKNIMKW